LRILIRGGGEMASAIAWRLHSCGMIKLLMTEVPQPLAVRRMVSFCEAIYEGTWTVEGIESARITDITQVETLWNAGRIPLMVDPIMSRSRAITPNVLIDAIMAKRNIGTRIDGAELVIGLGPGFCAGFDTHYVIETNRGHDLGKLIVEGTAAPDTGIPGNIGGKTSDRVIRSPGDGFFQSSAKISEMVVENQLVGNVGGLGVVAGISGVLRGLVRTGTPCTNRMKIGDVDPRGLHTNCFTISDKGRSIAGAALEGILRKYNTP